MMKISYPGKYILKYNQPVVNLAAAVFVTTLIVYPDKDERWIDILSVSAYLLLMLTSTCLSFLIFTWVFIVTATLAYNFHRDAEVKIRLIMQLFAGIVLPFFLSYFSTVWYFDWMEDGGQLHYNRHTLPMFAFIILSTNLLYYIYVDYFSNLLESENPNDRILIVNSGNNRIQIPFWKIAYIYHYNDFNWIRLFKSNINDKICVDESLDWFDKRLDTDEFNKISRQFLVNVHAVSQVKKENRSLSFFLDPPCEITEIKTNREKRKELEEWLVQMQMKSNN